MSHASPGRRLPVVTHRAPLLALVLLAACAAPAVCGGCGDPTDPADVLPASFRVEAEIVSVEPGPDVAPSAVDLCTPTVADIDPDGPDWQVRFDNLFDAAEPTFAEWTTSHNGDSAKNCLNQGATDCCQPLADAEGGGWTLACDGRKAPDPTGNGVFLFHFAADGSGSATYTRSYANGRVACIARTAWTAIIALER